MQLRVVLIALAAVAGVALLVWLLTAGGPQHVEEPVVGVDVLPTPTPAPEQRVILLFAGGDGLLHPELRSVPLPEEVHERIRVVMRELFAGPANSSRLAPVIPYQATVGAIFVDQTGQRLCRSHSPSGAPDRLEYRADAGLWRGRLHHS